MGRRQSVVIAADKTRSVDISVASTMINAIDSLAEGYSKALIVYGPRSMPLVDPESNVSLMEAYLSVPILGNRPEPALGLREALELASDYDLVEPLVVLLWSASVRPRIKVEPLLSSLERTGFTTKIVVLRSSPPKWIRYTGLDPESLYYVRSNTNMVKLASKLLEA